MQEWKAAHRRVELEVRPVDVEDGRWAHSSAFGREMVWKRFEIWGI